MLSIVTVVIVFSVLIVVHEFGHFMMAKRCGVRVEKFSLGFGPKVVGVKRGDTEYRISAIPLGGYVKMAGETHDDNLTGKPWEFLSKPPGERFKIIVSGAALNYILGIVLFTAVFMMGAPALLSVVGEVMDGTPAQKAGIRAGDRIISIDGQDIEYWDQLQAIVHKKTEGRLKLQVERNGRVIRLNVKPMVEERKDVFGNEVRIAIMGIRPSEELTFIKYDPAQSIYKGAVRTFELTALTFKAIWNMILGRLSVKDSVTGPVGIFVLTAKVARLGLVYLLNFMAVISISLAIFNVLPIPVLDGGHILFLIIEKVRRRPLSVKVQEMATQVGLGLLILLMMFVLYYDVLRLVNK